MDLYIFNPEHDIMLAANRDRTTPPRAARELRHDLGFLPALWAQKGDVVLVDDASFAHEAFAATGRDLQATLADRHMARQLLRSVPPSELRLCPWGWDRSIVRELREIGVASEWLPTDVQLDAIRRMRHRAWAAENLLTPLREAPGTIGESHAATTLDSCLNLLQRHSNVMAKAPWSSSGRGVRPLSVHDLTPSTQGWLTRIIADQGAVMIEPYYNKVLDFGVELTSDGHGSVHFNGLSLFYTEHGAYVGNLVIDESAKWQLLSAYIDRQPLTHLIDRLCLLLGDALRNVYAGPLGIDMMVVRQDDTLLLHPCVEMNLRATMGHVALLV